MTPIIQAGIGGLGRSGWDIHARLLAALPAHYRIAAVCDPLEARRQEAQARFGCAAYPSFDELLADPAVTLLVIATPSHTHADYAIRALEAGKAVVCEKPMAASLAEADAMLAAARRTGGVLTVFHNRRYSPDFVQVRKVLASGVLGRILLIRMTWDQFGRRWDWQTLKAFGGGALNNTGAHAIDQALQFITTPEPQVFCDLQRALSLGDAEDHVKLLLRAPGSPVVDIEISSACAYPQEPWLIMGTRGTLTGGYNALRWKYLRPDELATRALDPTPTPDRSYNRDEIPWHEESWSSDESPYVAWEQFYRDLHATLSEGAPLAITPESVRQVIWVIEQCRRAAST